MSSLAAGPAAICLLSLARTTRDGRHVAQPSSQIPCRSAFAPPALRLVKECSRRRDLRVCPSARCRSKLGSAPLFNQVPSAKSGPACLPALKSCSLSAPGQSCVQSCCSLQRPSAWNPIRAQFGSSYFPSCMFRLVGAFRNQILPVFGCELLENQETRQASSAICRPDLALLSTLVRHFSRNKETSRICTMSLSRSAPPGPPASRRVNRGLSHPKRSRAAPQTSSIPGNAHHFCLCPTGAFRLASKRGHLHILHHTTALGRRFPLRQAPAPRKPVNQHPHSPNQP